jgi:hypothetical protein
MNDELRLECLRIAQASGDANPMMILQRARAYLNFVSGKPIADAEVHVKITADASEVLAAAKKAKEAIKELR